MNGMPSGETSMRNDCTIISVESRKGGVGKTTAALNLARILLEKRGYAVLFLDVDITGTNATDCLDSPFWKDISHPVRDAKSKIRKAHGANLLDLFARRFMPGLDSPRFLTESTKDRRTREGTLLLVPDKINVIGSQIYDFNGSANEDKDTCICKPSILFDELHAFWFIEFLQKTCEAFLEAIRKDEPNRAVAVIVDNSPGYVGIGPAIQDWLTDLGPDRGKFLTVSSLDKQDLLSCGDATHNLHQLYERKWRASRKFAEATNSERDSGEEFLLAPNEEGFFLRMAETPSLLHASRNPLECTSGVSGGDLAFYCRANAEVGGAYLDQPETYQGLVINRVPRLVKRGVYTYDTEQMYSLMRRKGSHLLDHLLGDERSTYTDWMVSYDESIEYQFVQPMISRRIGRMSRRKARVEDFMRVIEERYPIPPDEILQGMLHEGAEFHPRVLGEVRMYLRRLHESVVAGIRFVEQAGFSHLTHLIEEEWLPSSVLRDLRTAMQDILLETGFPFVEFGPWEADDDRDDAEIWEFASRLRHKAEQYFKKRELEVPLETIGQFLPSLTAVVSLSVSRRWLHSPLGEELPELLAGVVSIEALHWMRHRERSRKRMGIQKFLAAERLVRREWRELQHQFPISPRRLEQGDFSRLYRACASAQARLIDVRRDTEFLIALIQRLVMEDIREAPVLPYVRGIAEKVIVRKTLSHEAGQETIAHGFSSAQYMEEFSEVLEKILARWER